MDILDKKHQNFVNKWQQQGFTIEYLLVFNSFDSPFTAIAVCQIINDCTIGEISGPFQSVQDMELLDKRVQLRLIGRYNCDNIGDEAFNMIESGNIDEQVVEKIIQVQAN